VAVAGIVVLMTYVIMPVLTNLAAGWLFEKPDQRSQAFLEDELQSVNSGQSEK
jgi:antibiotic biosynthesis monooxygenase (ABM) superfamily enzyme